MSIDSEEPSSQALGDLERLARLRAAWINSNAARGGVSAMAGFDFQIAKAVLQIIKQADAGRGETFIEVLSDIIAADGGITITQAKRTLSSGSLHSALAELWDIDELALKTTPDLQPRLKYHVTAARRALMDWSASMARWAPDGADAERLKAFKARVTVSVADQPRLEAARLLVAHYKDSQPFDRIDRIVGRLLELAESGPDEAIKRFRLELKALKNAAASAEWRFGLWGVEDRPPAQVTREINLGRAVRVGERLTVADLREGRLAPRSIYDAVEASAEAWLQSNSAGLKLPMFWIEGRSGCGKSAALLNLCARLHAQNPERVILWLGESSNLIAEAVRWSADLLLAGHRVLIAIDDPCTPDRQEGFTRAAQDARIEWERIRAQGGAGIADRPPALVCCGPTEQRMAAEDRCGGDIETTEYELKPEAIEDRAELARWFEQRTGRAVQALDGNVLLVQQFFEWAEGSIEEFSRRFRARLQGFDHGVADGPVFSTVAEILALGRLYVDFPSDQLAARRRDNVDVDVAFMHLAEDQAHFSFEPGPGGGVRLTHPHLADAIYSQWFGRRTDKPLRRRHLAQALQAALAQHNSEPTVRNAPLWAIQRLATERDYMGRPVDPDLRARIELIRPELGDVLRDIYAARPAEDAPLENLPVWLALEGALDLALIPSPIDELVRSVASTTEPARGLRLSCHRLLMHRGRATADAHAAVAGLLTRAASWRPRGVPWHELAALITDFVYRVGVDPIVPVLDAMVRSEPEWSSLGKLLAEVVERAPASAVVDIAVEWLTQGLSTQPGWVEVLLSLRKARGSFAGIEALALRYLKAQPDDTRWDIVWSALLDDGVVDPQLLVRRGALWLGIPVPGQTLDDFQRSNDGWDSSGHRGFDRVWQRLWALEASAPDRLEVLFVRAMRWLDEVDPANDGWTRIWQQIWEAVDPPVTPHRRAELFAFVEPMLRAAPPSLTGWSHVWNPAFKAADGAARERLLGLASDWLATAGGEHLGWSYVWERLVEEADAEVRDRLLLEGEAWLQRVGFEHRSWAFVWRQLFQHAEPDSAHSDRLLELGLDWSVTADPSGHGWRLFWDNIFKLVSAGQRARVLSCASARLAASIGWPGWSQVFIGCAQFPEMFAQREAIGARALDWLGSDGVGSPSWAGVWHALRLTADGKALAALAADYLDLGAETVRVRAKVCSRALFMCPAGSPTANRLLHHAEPLLRDLGDDRQWAYLWNAITQRVSEAERPVLLAKASEWLGENGLGHPQWDLLFLRVRQQCGPGADALAGVRMTIARALETPSAPARWISAWKSLDDGTLLAIPDIRAAAKAVLPATVDEVLWPALWSALLADARRHGDIDAILAVGTGWLKANVDDRAWGFVWTAAYKVAPLNVRDELIELGRAYLIDVERPCWGQVIAYFARGGRHGLISDSGTIALADQWLLATDVGNRNWPLVIGWRVRFNPVSWSNPAFRCKSLEWLAQAGPRALAWSFVWRPLHDTADPAEAEWLRELAEARLRESPDNPSWTYLWLVLWHARAGDAGGRARLRELATQWFKICTKPHPQAGIVASKLRSRHEPRSKAPSLATGGR